MLITINTINELIERIFFNISIILQCIGLFSNINLVPHLPINQTRIERSQICYRLAIASEFSNISVMESKFVLLFAVLLVSTDLFSEEIQNQYGMHRTRSAKTYVCIEKIPNKTIELKHFYQKFIDIAKLLIFCHKPIFCWNESLKKA